MLFNWLFVIIDGTEENVIDDELCTNCVPDDGGDTNCWINEVVVEDDDDDEEEEDDDEILGGGSGGGGLVILIWFTKLLLLFSSTTMSKFIFPRKKMIEHNKK